MDNTVIEFKNVTKIYKLFKSDRQRFKAMFSKKANYKKKIAVDNLSFKIEKGEAVALFGKNGAGKSTILKMITGVTYPTSGEIDVNGRVSALLELTAGFDPEFTGRENIYFRGQLFGMTNEEIKALEPEVVEFADLSDYIDQPVRTYSSGMKARLGFSIATIVEPDILILDEVLSVGDAKFRKKSEKKIMDMFDKGITVLFVSHNESQIKNICTKAILLEHGEMTASGTVDEVLPIYKKLTE